MTQNEALELYIELEDMIRRMREFKHRVGEFIGRDTLDRSPRLRESRVQRIINAVMEADEHASRMGREAPNDLGVAPDYESQQHEVYVPERFCNRCDACGE